MSTLIRYPYDPVGDSPESKVVGERYALSSIINGYRCIVPEYAPFYRKGLIVKSWPSGQTLVEGKHFELGMRYSQEKEIANEDLFGAIRFMDVDIGGEVEIVEYQTVGGNFTRGGKKILEYLVNYLLDPLNVYWENVINKLDEFPVMAHAQDWHDFTNKETIAASIDGITTAAQNYAAALKTESIDYLNARITQLDNLVTSTNFDKHIINMANPHGVTAADVEAMVKTGVVKDAFKLYAMTLKELADYINAQGITQADLNAYMAKYDDAIITNRLILRDGKVKLVNTAGTSTVDLKDGDISLRFAGAGYLGADRARTKAGKVAKWQAGKNILKATSEAGGYSKDNLKFNEKVVIHLGNIRQHLNGIDFGTVYLTTGSTESAILRGDGRAADPLRVDVKYPAATDEVKGVGIVATVYGQSTTAFIAAKLLADLVRDLTGYVPTSRTINGHPLSADVTISPADVNLDQVDNTADLAKPISQLQQAELNRYAEANHTHAAEQLSLPIATDAAKGITYLYSNTISFDEGVVTPSALVPIMDSLIKQRALVDSALDADALPVVSLSFDATIQPKTPNPPTGAADSVVWTVVIDSNQILYMNRNRYYNEQQEVNLREVVPTGSLANKLFYVYVTAASANAFQYVITDTYMKTSDTMLYAGEFTTGAAGPGTHSLGEHQSFGMFRELLDHINDDKAHMHDSNVKDKFGLALVENYPMAHAVSPLSAWSFVNDWRNVTQDALAGGWFKGIDQRNNTIKINTTGLTFAGVVGHSMVCDNINMWDHIGADTTATLASGDISQWNASSVEFKAQWSGKALNSAPSAALSWLGVMLGNAKDSTNREVQLNVTFGPDSAANLIIPLCYDVRGNDTIRLLANAPKDPIQVNGNLEEMAGTTPVRVTVYWLKHKTTGAKRIRLVAEVGEWRNTGDMASIVIDEADVAGDVARKAAFDSGRIGMVIKGHIIGNVSMVPKLLADKKQYASANMLIEALARGSGVVSLSGQVAGNMIPMPAGCSKALVMASLAEWTADAGYYLNSVTTKVWWRDGNGNTGNAINEPIRFPSTDPLWQQLTGQVESKNGTASKLASGLKYNYLVIGFVDPIIAKIID